MRRLLLVAVVLAPVAAAAQTGGSPQPGPGVAADNDLAATKRDARLFPSVVDGLSKAADIAALRALGANATPGIQEAWAKGAARVPCGDYRLDAGLTAPASNTALLAEAAGCVRVFVNFPAGDVVSVPAGMGNIRIENIAFLAAVNRTSGAVIHVGAASYVSLIGIKAEGTGGNRFADGIVLEGSTVVHAERLYLSDHTGDCIRLGRRAVDTYLAAINTASCHVGLRLRSASGVYANRLDLIGSAVSGLVIDPVAANGDSVDAVIGDTVLSDTSAGPGIQVIGDGKVTEINIGRLWAGASGTSGVFTAQQVLDRPQPGLVVDNPLLDGMTLTAPMFKGNGAEGADIRRGHSITLIGARAMMNGASYGVVPPGGTAPGTTRYVGLRIRGAADFVNLQAPTAGAGGWELGAGLTMKQSHGLVREAGTGGQSFTLMGGQWPGNVTGDYTIGTAAGDHVIDIGNGH